jgi:hypothetical protein
MNNIDIEDFNEEDKVLWQKLGEIETPQPSLQSKANFYAMLDTFSEKEIKPKEQSFWDKMATIFFPKPLLNVGFSLMLMTIAGLLGFYASSQKNETLANQEKMNNLNNEVSEIKQMLMLTMLENPSASERMKAVSFTQEMNSVDNQVIEALFSTLNFDENDNVRLSTLEALVELADNPKVREGLVQSLMIQESPLVQVALADIMVKLQEKKSIHQLKKLKDKKGLNNTVKQKIEKTILQLA